MRGRHPELPVELTPDERLVLSKLSRLRTAPYCEVVRAKALIMAADGARNVEIAAATGQDPRTVSILRKEFGERRLKALKDNDRPGGPRAFSP